MPIRRIPRNYRSVTGYVPSDKNGRSIAYESTLERDFFVLQEFRTGISSYTEQPLVVKYTIGNRTGTHVPDALVEYASADPFGRRFELVDVKYRADIAAHWTEYKPRFRATMTYARQRSWRYSLWTEVEIRCEELRNAELLLPLRGCSIPACAPVIMGLAQASRPIGELVNLAGQQDAAEALRWVLVLLANDYLSADFSKVLNKHSNVGCGRQMQSHSAAI